MKLLVPTGLASLAVVLVSLAHGEYPVSLDDLWMLVWQPDANPVLRQIVFDVRLPRAVLALLVGAALGVSGVLAQSILRNPLGEPGLLGVNSGAALVITILVVMIPQAGETTQAIGAFAGAVAVVAMIYGFSIVIRASMPRLVLVGVGIAALTGGLATGISLLGDVETAQRLMTWLAGSVYDSTWSKLATIAPFLALPALVSWSLARHLDVLAIGDDIARGLGLRLQLTTATALISCALLAAISVTLAGPIAFVGLIAPHIARRLGATDHALLLPMAGLVGAFVVVSADLLGRTLMPPVQLPVGLVTPLLGVPMICFLVVSRRYFGKQCG